MNKKLTKISRSNLEKENLIDVETEKIEMSLNTESSLASGLLIQRLTELYENPIVASVRETVSNALDALVKSSKIGGSVWIEKPTKINPVFVVRDNGVGMSYEDLKNVYAKYGASTKVDNFNQIGAYGLGAKAPLAYGTEFTVTSVKNGEKTIVMVIREELTNYIKVIERSKTEEESGTTVSIPVSFSDVMDFANEADKYGLYPLGQDGISIYVNGQKNEEENYLCVSDNLETHNDGENIVLSKVWIKNNTKSINHLLKETNSNRLSRQLKYLVGGWVYENPRDKNFFSSKDGEIIIEVKPGILGFNSSRDSILPNDRYSEFEDMVKKGLASRKFYNSVMESIKNLDEQNFRDVMLSLASQSISELTRRRNSNLNVNDLEDLGHEKYNTRYSLLEEEAEINPITLKNKDGYSLEQMLSKIPNDKEGNTFTLRVEKAKYSKINKLFSFACYNQYGFSYSLNNNTVSEAKEKYEAVMFQGKKLQLWEILLFKLMSDSKNTNYSSFFTLFITDVKGEEKGVKSLFSNRKKILDLTSNISSQSKFNSYITFTTHTKEEIEAIVEDANLKEDSKVITMEEAENLLKKDRKNNRKMTAKKEVPDMKYYIYYEDNEGHISIKNLTFEDIEDLSKKENKIHFLTLPKSEYLVNFNSYKLMKNWIFNREESENHILVISQGPHRKSDLESISNMGEFYYKNSLAGSSEFYKSLVDNKRIGKDFFLNTNPNMREIAFSMFLSHIFKSLYTNYYLSNIKEKVRKLKDLCEVAGVDYKELNLEEIKKAEEKNNIDASAKTLIRLQDLSKYLSPEDKICIEKLSAVNASDHLRDKVYYFDKEGNLNVSGVDNILSVSINNLEVEDVKSLFKSEDTIANSIAKEQVKKIISVYQENLLSINEIKF